MDTPQHAPAPQAALGQLARRETQWRHIDALLRRLLSQLTREVGDRNAALVATLSELRQALPPGVDEAHVPPLLDALNEAVRALDDPADPAPASPAEAPALPAAAPLLAVLARLQLAEDADSELETLRRRIATCGDPQALCRHGEALAALVSLQIRQTEQGRRAAERLLFQINAQLATLSGSLEQGEDSRRAADAARRRHDDAVSDGLKALDARIQSAPDLASLQAAAQAQLAALDAHLRAAREREQSREHDWRQQAEHMRWRIRQLEQSARHMKLALEKRRQLSDTDMLTGLANRRALEARMAALCRAPATAASLLMLDIDHFKHINDGYGHVVGDRALRLVAEQLQAALRPGDFLARYGGEEFVAVLPVAADEALRVAERLRERIGQTSFHAHGQPVRITLSCGVAALRDGDTPEGLFERADQALYRAKQAGRNRSMQ